MDALSVMDVLSDVAILGVLGSVDVVGAVDGGIGFCSIKGRGTEFSASI